MPIINFLSSLEFPAETWIIIIAMALTVGIARSGIFGVMVIVVPVLALFLGGREAAGFVLPWMILGDWIAVFYYRKNVKWDVILRILPWLVIGILLGAGIGSRVSDRMFRNLMGGITFLSLAILLWKEKQGGLNIHYSLGIIGVIGIVSGFGSMVGNIAGPIIALYFFTLRLDKISYVSTMVALFWIVNMIKVPFHVFYWETINAASFKLNLLLSPLLLLGAFLGFKIIKRIPEKPFKVVILISIGAAGVALFM